MGSFGLNTKRITTLGILIALSLVTFMLENLLPPLFLPGAKIGLSNVFSLITLFMYTPVDAIILVIIRTTLSCFIVGNVSSLIYSLTAGIVSIIVSSIFVKFLHPKISVLAISIVSAVIHNIVQVLVFCLVVSSSLMISYLPYLALIGVLSGAIVGTLVYLVIHKVPITYYEKLLINYKEQNKEETIC